MSEGIPFEQIKEACQAIGAVGSLITQFTKSRKKDKTELPESNLTEPQLEPEEPEYLLPPLPDSGFFLEGSRDAEIERLSNALQEKKAVYIWGLGGIGKTELAIALAREVKPDGRAYLVKFQNSMRETIMGMNFHGYHFTPDANTRPEGRSDAEYQDRLDLLWDHYKDALLIIDNLDCSGKILEQVQGEPSFRDLLKLGISCVFTTRYIVKGQPELLPLSNQQLLSLMHHYCPDDTITDARLLPLIEAVNGHTLTVVLMAKTLEESWGRVTPETLLDALHDSQLNRADFPDVVSDQNQSYEQRQIFAHLKALFDLSEISDAGRTVLACATLLPESGMDALLFETSLTDEESKELHTLVKRGWLQRSTSNLLTIHPVIRDVCREEIHPTDELCHDFLEQLGKQYDPSHSLPTTWEQFAACFALASDTLDDETGNYAAYAGVIYGELCVYDYALKYNQRSLDIQKRNLPKDSSDMAVSYNKLGLTYENLGDHQKSLEYLLKALDILKKSLPPNHPNLAQSYNNVGYAHGEMGDHQKELKYKLKSLEILENTPGSKPSLLAISYNNVGYTYGELGDHQKALEYHLKALEIRQKSLPPNHPDLAASCNYLGATYFQLGQYQDALTHLNQALSILDQTPKYYQHDRADICLGLALVYASMGDEENAAFYRQCAQEEEP